jgi:hypothetical protein
MNIDTWLLNITLSSNLRPSVSHTEAKENGMPIYAQVDMSKKRRKRQQDDMPIYAQVDKSKKKVG